MDIFNSTDLKKLLQMPGTPRVSLYQPTTPGGGEKDRIICKNLLADAEERLHAYGLQGQETKGLLAPALRLLEDQSFWKQAHVGLACFLSPGQSRVVRLPRSVPPQVAVSNLFNIKPLLPFVTDEQVFYVLALSRKSVKLWRGAETELHEVDIAGLPKGLADALRFHDRDEPLLFHSRRSGADWGGIFHGQGVGIDTAKDDLLLYFQQIDRALHDFLRQEKAPLIVASVDYLLPIYREANSYPHLLREGIAGSPDHMAAAELHAKARRLLSGAGARGVQEAVELFHRVKRLGCSCTYPLEVIKAACAGKLQVLFVPTDLVRWGVVDPASQTVELHEQALSGDEDLLNVAAIRTFLSGGKVFALPAQDIPGGLAQAGIAWLPMDKHAK